MNVTPFSQKMSGRWQSVWAFYILPAAPVSSHRTVQDSLKYLLKMWSRPKLLCGLIYLLGSQLTHTLVSSSLLFSSLVSISLLLSFSLLFFLQRHFPAWSILCPGCPGGWRHFINDQWSFCSIPSTGNSQPFPLFYNPEYFQGSDPRTKHDVPYLLSLHLPTRCWLVGTGMACALAWKFHASGGRQVSTE